MTRRWEELRRPGYEGNPIGQAKADVLKRYNRPWWRAARAWDRLLRRFSAGG